MNNNHISLIRIVTLLIAVGFCLGAAGNPANDMFTNAVPLAGTSVSVLGSNLGASRESGEPSLGNSSATVWWTWTAPVSGYFTIDTANSNFDTVLGVYRGSSVSNLTVVTFDNGEFPLDTTSEVTFRANSNQVYRIMVGGHGTAVGHIGLNLFFRPPPSNDMFTNAIPLSGSAISVVASNRFASVEQWEPAHGGHTGGSSVWWSWVAPASGAFMIDTINSNFDTLLGVYTGNSVSSLNVVAWDDDGGGAFTSTVVINATNGQVYHIAVDGGWGNYGRINLHISPTVVPANDLFSKATLLTGSNIMAAGSNEGAWKEPGEPKHAGSTGGASIWWKWVAPAAGTFAIRTTNSNFDTLLGIYTGTNVMFLSKVASNNNVGLSLESHVIITAASNQLYYIAVDGYYGGRGYVELSIAPILVPANDLFANATPLSGSSVSVVSFNRNASVEAGEPYLWVEGGRSVWWTWVAPASGPYAVSTTNSNFDTLLGVYNGNALSDIFSMGSNDNRSPDDLTSLVVFNAISNEVYHIAVDGYEGSSGDIALNLLPIALPSNDMFDDAIALNGFSVATFGSNVGASKEAGELDHEWNSGGASVWWSWTAPASGRFVIEANNSSIITLMDVYIGNSVSNLALMGSRDWEAGGITVEAISNQVYHIMVDGYDGEEGGIGLGIHPVAANDMFTNAFLLNGTNISVLGYNGYASMEPDEPEFGDFEFGTGVGRSVWWKWVAPCNGVLSVNATEERVYTVIGVFIGDTLTNLTEASYESYDWDGLTVQVKSNQVYRIIVDSMEDPTSFGGTFGLNLSLLTAPPNDFFSDAIVLDGLNVSFSGSNLRASKELGEPDHVDGGGGSASVWWTWAAPFSGMFEINTANSDFDTLLAVYTGNSITSLQLIAANDDGGVDSTSRVLISVVRDQVYHIVADGFYGRVGNVSLNISPAETDDDNDQLPDWWEIYHFAGDVVADSDFDGDGMSNLQEYLAGTDPRQSQSVFAFAGIARDAQPGIIIQWPSVANKTYHLLRSSEVDGIFKVIETDLSATPPLNVYRDTNASGTGPFFYRLRIDSD